MKKINIDFTNSTVGNLGRAGEHNNTEIIFALSPELAKCDFLTAEIGTAAGDKIPIEGTYNEENNTFSILLTNQLTAEGKISLQLVGYVTDSETAEPQIIAKSPVVSGFITEGINGVETAAESNPNLLARIWTKIREWANKIHTHENYWTLTDFYCEASELEADNEFPILPDYVGVDRPTFRGNHLRYSSDGGVIRKVEEKGDGDDKFLRMWFDKGVLDTLFDVPDFIDIPVKLVNEKVEEIVGPGLTSNSTGLELDLGVGTGGGLTSEQAAQLELNTFNIQYLQGQINMFNPSVYATHEQFNMLAQNLSDALLQYNDGISYELTAINARIDGIEGGINEIEAMIDESGVLD